MRNIEKLSQYFDEYYKKIFCWEYPDVEAAIFTEMGDILLKDEEMINLAKALCAYKGKRCISTDTDAAAFALAVYRYDAEEEYKRINNF